MSDKEIERLKNRRAKAHLEYLLGYKHCIHCGAWHPIQAKICPECARTNDQRPQKARGEV